MAKSKKKNKLQGINKKEIHQAVAKYLACHPGEYFGLKQLFRAMKFTTHPLKMLCIDVLNDMLEHDDIVRNDEGEISYNGHPQLCEGVFHRTAGGRNFVDLPDGVGISIYDEDTLHALPGDVVKVCLLAKRRGSRKLHGQVVEIVRRNEKPYLGTLHISKSAAFLVTYDDVLPHDILIPLEHTAGANNGDKVLVAVTSWPDRSRNPIGRVVEVLGAPGNNDTEMHAILAEFGLPTHYPEEVERAANQISDVISEEEIGRRLDYRSVNTFTIDPRDAKDFDDALSIRSSGEGLWEVGVHIADVSHYVLEGSIIDREAQNRATSIYLVDRTIPMLPERLCNGICSLRPNEEKLAFSVIFDMNDQAEILAYRVVHTVIRSNRRFVYEEVQHLLEHLGEASAEDMQIPTPEQPFIPENGPALNLDQPGEMEQALVTLNRMAHQLRERRMGSGSIDFDRQEARFDIDENGKPTSVYFKRSKDANKLVEEFMLLANRAVAETVSFGLSLTEKNVVKKKTPKAQAKTKVLPYRVHDLPDPGKLEQLEKSVARFGLTVRTQGTKTEVAKSLNRLLKEVQGQPMQQFVELVSLRAMMKARYSTFNIGHYGLGFDHYTHFTSPIRRYPDLMVHRLLTRYAEGGRSASQKKYEELCQHSSEMEVLATNAERASIKYKQVEFMADKLGQEFDAMITGVTEFGLYAEIDEYKIEGLIAVRFLGDEPFDFDERNFCLFGRRTHTRYTLGDKIRIRVAKANLLRKQLDFDIVTPETAANQTPKKKFFEKL